LNLFILGRLVRERERLHGMTNEERLWRAQYLKDQILSNTEPRYVPEYWEARLNPIRKFYRYPLDRLQDFLIPRIVRLSCFHHSVTTAISLIFLNFYPFSGRPKS